MRSAASIHERALIGLAILHEDKHQLVDVEPGDFADKRLGAMWAEIRKHTKVDTTLLRAKFDENELSAIITDAPVPGSIEREAARVREAAHRRRVVTALGKVTEMVTKNVPMSDIARYVISTIDGVPSSQEAAHIAEALVDAYAQVERAWKGDNVNFIPTGFGAIDGMFGGLSKSGLVIVAGRPSMGKTAFALGLANNAARHGPVLMVSMEMTREQLAMRLMAAEVGVDLQRLMQGSLAVDDFRRLCGAVESLRDRNIWINDLTSRDIGGVVAEARRFKRARGDIRMLVIDYLTLLKLPKGERTDLRIAEVSRALKILAGELDCPVVLLSQLNRKLEERPLKDRRPRMSDLRDSGAIEQDADQIIFLFREEVYQKTPGNEGLAEVIMAKNRNGRTGIAKMAWRAACASFADLADDEQ